MTRSPDPRAKPIGIGLIGVGAIGGVHLDLLAGGVPGLRLAAVADIDHALAERCGYDSGVPSYGSAEELVRDPAVDAVLIATPAETHSPIVETAAAAGKHILCEKPLETDLNRLDSALQAARDAGVLLQVGLNRRFDNNFQLLQEEIAAERIGEVITAHIVSRDPLLTGPPRRIEALSGLFFDTAVHDFDILRFLTGSEIEMVHVQASSAVHGGPDIDTAVILVRMTSGVIATIDNSQAVYHYDQRVEVFGTGGALFAGNERLSTVTLAGQDGTRLPAAPFFFPQRYRQSYLNQLGAFARSLASGEPPVPSGADGRAATVAALAAQQSLDEGRPVWTQQIG